MIFASSNKGKILEAKEILQVDLKSLNDLEKPIEIEETGSTFMENAILKAKEVYNRTHIPTISDDSGLEIPALNGFPGVKTHRFLKGTDRERNEEILIKMKNIEDRTCYFVCSVAYFDGIQLKTSEYRLKGEIAPVIKENKGFGFDSIFLYHGVYLSDMQMEEKNNISPRKNALLKLKNLNFFQKNVDFQD